MITRYWTVLMLVLAAGPFAAPGQGAVVIDFDLQVGSVTSSTADVDVLMTFSGAPTDTVEGVQLSVWGSDPALTSFGTDFSRFAFVLNMTAPPLSAWDSSGTLPLSGLELAFPSDPSFITPGDIPLNLGTLSVDLSRIAPGTQLMISLAGGFPGLDTDAGGTFGGQFVPSAAADPTASVTFADPGGVTFSVPGDTQPIPEPASLSIWLLLAATMAAAAFQRRRHKGKERI